MAQQDARALEVEEAIRNLTRERSAMSREDWQDENKNDGDSVTDSGTVTTSTDDSDVEEKDKGASVEGREDVFSDISSDSDLFEVHCLEGAEWKTEQDEELERIEQVAMHMRAHPLCPPHPSNSYDSWLEIQHGVRLPDLHCAFAGCPWTGALGDPPSSLERHICRDCPKAPWKPGESYQDKLEYYQAAVEHVERQKMADVGNSIDRRTFRMVLLRTKLDDRMLHSIRKARSK